ncbi:MAG: hypothetical protein JSS95_07015 [Acidobacteria bacterium]|nr:hypothetical protein [Acidobacteriota bacterium]
MAQNSHTSRHTGKELFELEVQFTAHEAQSDSIREALSGKGCLLSADGDTSKDVTVLLFQKTHSYTDGRPIQSYIWTLTQEEELKVDDLQLADVTLQPYWFTERFDEDALIISARVEVDAATEQSLRNLPQYFPVIRKGISDEPRTMRFGQILWSSVEEEKFKLGITIVEKIYDEQKKTPALFQPQLRHISNTLAVAGARIAKLLDILQEKGVLTEEERVSIAEVPDAERRKRVGQFDRVDDLDAWLGDDD